MLAGLLLNEVFSGAPTKRKRKEYHTGIYGGKFIMVDGYTKDIEKELSLIHI